MEQRVLICFLLASLVPVHGQGQGCRRPGHIGNGKILTEQENFVTGNVITYQCHHNYNLVGDSQRTCLYDGQWSGNQPYCEGKGCSRPSDITHGYILPDEESFVTGNVISYHCEKEGYMLMGDAQRTCGADGQWTGNQPHCAVPGPCHKQHGRPCSQYARCEKPQYERDYKCICNDGYQGDGVNCHPVDPCRKHNGQGCHQHARCERNHHQNDYRCVCNDGYDGDGVNNCYRPNDCERYLHQKCHMHADCITISHNEYECRCKHGYTGDGFYCQGKGCGRPNEFSRGRFIPDQDSYVTGNVITYQCDGGYQLMGNSQRTCQENSQWSGNQPRCETAGPCFKQYGHTCHQNARCSRPQNERDYRCVCNSGYQGDGINCQMLDPCKQHNGKGCHQNARCEQHHPGAYRCVCNDGYDGDGAQRCYRPDNCERYLNRKCHEYADCITISDKKYECQCRHGYTGNGYNCEAAGCQRPDNVPHGKFLPDRRSYASGNVITYQCDNNHKLLGNSQRTCQGNSQWSGNQPRCEVSDPCHRQHGQSCHQHARCEIPQYEKNHRCVCNTGYTGDGINCHLPDPCVKQHSRGCHQNARCQKQQYSDDYRCICNDGYQGDGVQNCHRIDNCQQYLNQKCHKYADCITTGDRAYECQCRHGYTGNGIFCEVEDKDPCRSQYGQPCDLNARCEKPQNERNYRCICNNGYTGDGVNCRLSDPCHRQYGQECHEHARCTARPGASDYICICNKGYEGDGVNNCKPMDVCEKNLVRKCHEHAVCSKVNDKKSKCVCKAGYKGNGIKCQDTSCPLPDGIENGQFEPIQDRYLKGNTITYQCNQGFTLKGNGQRRCQANRRWTGKAPRCAGVKPTSCPRPKGIKFGTVGALPQRLEGSKAFYACDSGYTLVGDAERTCMAPGRWSGSSPKCAKSKVVTCRRPASIPHGMANAPPMPSVGTKVKYTCDPGYALSGNSERTCMASGAWSGSEPTCEMTDPCRSLQNRPCHQNAWCDGGQGGRAYRCVCHDGYRGDGYGCQKLKATNCPRPTDIAQGSTISPPALSVGSKVKYTCDYGYTLSGNSERTCLPSGTWSGSKPICKKPEATGCRRPDSIAHGAANAPSIISVGSRVKYSCDAGYTLSGNSERTCMASGVWSGSEPSCGISDPCRGIQNRPCHHNAWCEGGHSGKNYRCVCHDGYNGDGYNCQMSDPCQRLQNRPCHQYARCDAGRSGRDHRCVCNDGYNGDGYDCKQSKATTCRSPDSIAHGMVDVPSVITVGSRAKYSCDPGYTLSGNSERTCMRSGLWSGNQPSCGMSDPCHSIQNRPCHNNAWCEGGHGGMNYRCVCHNGYTGDGYNCKMSDHCSGAQNRPCHKHARCDVDRCVCNDGYTGDGYNCKPRDDDCAKCHKFATCIHVADRESRCECWGGYKGDGYYCEVSKTTNCPHPSDIAHGKVTKQDEYIANTKITYVCDRGYQLIGDRQRTCLSSGHWSGSDPRCEKPDPCHRLQNRPCHQHARCDGGYGGKDHRCVCNDGYKGDGYNCQPHKDDDCDKCHVNADCIRITGQKTRCQCRHGFKGDGYYCQGSGCPRPGCIAHGTITNSQGPFTEGNKITYLCYEGYILKGNEKRTCLGSGQWSGTEPRCEEKPRIECGYTGQTCHKYAECVSVGAGFECRCKGPYKGDGINCQVKGCQRPGCVGNGRLLTTQEHFIEGNKITYQCDQGFVMKSESERTCLSDGRWSGEEPRCEVPDQCHKRYGWPCGNHARCERRHGEEEYRCICNEGYSGDGRNCKSEGCDWPQDIVYGRLMSDYSSFVVGNFVRYECDHGYTMRGDPQRECLPGGRWSGKAPRCM